MHSFIKLHSLLAFHIFFIGKVPSITLRAINRLMNLSTFIQTDRLFVIFCHSLGFSYRIFPNMSQHGFIEKNSKGRDYIVLLNAMCNVGSGTGAEVYYVLLFQATLHSAHIKTANIQIDSSLHRMGCGAFASVLGLGELPFTASSIASSVVKNSIISSDVVGASASIEGVSFLIHLSCKKVGSCCSTTWIKT